MRRHRAAGDRSGAVDGHAQCGVRLDGLPLELRRRAGGGRPDGAAHLQGRRLPADADERHRRGAGRHRAFRRPRAARPRPRTLCAVGDAPRVGSSAPAGCGARPQVRARQAPCTRAGHVAVGRGCRRDQVDSRCTSSSCRLSCGSSGRRSSASPMRVQATLHPASAGTVVAPRVVDTRTVRSARVTVRTRPAKGWAAVRDQP